MCEYKNKRKRGFGPSYFLIIIHKAPATISTKRLYTKGQLYSIPLFASGILRLPQKEKEFWPTFHLNTF